MRRLPLGALAALAAVMIAAGQPAPALAQNAAAATASAVAPGQALDGLSWLAGCWARDRAEPGSVEHWLPLAGGSMLGVSRSVRQGRTVAHEFMQIRRRADGAVVFIAQPSGQAETSFVLQAGLALEAVFENPGHDFPQRVIYRRLDGGHMQARVEGQRRGVPAAVNFAFTRTPCDAPVPVPVPVPTAPAPRP